MAGLTASWYLDSVFLFCGVCFGVYLFFKMRFRYWEERGVPHTRPSFPMGDMGEVNISKNICEVIRSIYDAHSEERFVGLWALCRPMLLVRDPELIKNMLVKDFASFHDRNFYVNEKDDPLTAHLFSIGGNKWRYLKTKLSPTFTSAKMKIMFPAVLECSEELSSLLQEPASAGEVIEVKEISARFTTDVISSCAFGIQTNSLKNPDATFRKMGKRVMAPSFEMSWRYTFPLFLPKVAELLGFRLFPRDVSDFFMGAVRETMDFRKKHNVQRDDFMQLLIQIMDKGRVDDVDETGDDNLGKFTFEQAAAQAFMFFVAGFETSSTTMQFALYELAVNPIIQERVREEMKTVMARHEGKLTYEAVFEMEYLGRVIDETLRKYPAVSVLFRDATKDYKIPDSNVVIEKGTQVHFSVLGLHRDPEHFPNPERFDPDRFTEDAKAQRHHYAYLPFGEGPRRCIGMRFGLMQTRVGLIALISNFSFEMTKETPYPITFDPRAGILTPRGGLNLRIRNLNKLRLRGGPNKFIRPRHSFNSSFSLL